MNKVYRVSIVNTVEIDVEAENVESAKEIALVEWSRAARYFGEVEVDVIEGDIK